MKKTIFLVLMMLCIVSTNAQTKLAGRTYYNGNIMTGMMDKIMRESEAQMKEKLDNVIAEAEKKKGRKLSEEEKKKVKEQAMAESKALLSSIMKTALTIDFKDEKKIAINMDITINEEAMKKIGIGWLQRKALKALVSVVPNFKGEYKVKDNLVITYDGGEPSDTIQISPDGKQLYGKMDDTKYTVTRIK